MQPLEKLVELLESARRIFIFTGAGISTASGIPDFRGPQGVWTTRRPVFFDEFLRSEEKRIEYWEYKLDAWKHFKDAQPNAAHRSIVDLETAGKAQCIVTQNIDGLHQAAGSAAEKVIELQGTNRWVECVRCAKRSPPHEAMIFFLQHHRVPLCACGGPLKSATVSFGQALDPKLIERATNEAFESDLIVALGSTLSVYPAAGIPLLASQRGIPYVIVNRGMTEHDEVASLRIEGDVSQVFPAAVTKCLDQRHA